MFQGFLPLFIGEVLARYGEPVSAILVGAVATSLITSGFAALNLPLAAQNILNAFILLVFVVLATNQGKFAESRLRRERKKGLV
jgi:ribose transport system permease protein